MARFFLLLALATFAVAHVAPAQAQAVDHDRPAPVAGEATQDQKRAWARETIGDFLDEHADRAGRSVHRDRR